ncbi:MAG: glycosyltransferase [Planctomycetota bacterium]
MVARVCLVSGGTGGHLMPALVLARALRARGDASLLVTEGRAVERDLLAQCEADAMTAGDGDPGRAGDAIEVASLPAGTPSRLGLPLWLWRATVAARRLLRQHRVDCVVSTGGRASLPVGLAARSLRLPLFLLEQNAVTGRVNRLLAPFATRTWLGLPGPLPESARALRTGTPLRAELYATDREAARRELDLAPEVPVLLITGGSQGAQRLNELAPDAVALLPGPLQVVHLCGRGPVALPARDEALRRRYAQMPHVTRAIVQPLSGAMARLLAAADLVLCRGGGTTMAELCAVGRPAVVVPYPHHKDRQQLRNAEVLAAAGAVMVVEERDLDARRLAAVVGDVLGDPRLLAAMAGAARRLCSVDPVATILADMHAHLPDKATDSATSPAPGSSGAAAANAVPRQRSAAS